MEASRSGLILCLLYGACLVAMVGGCSSVVKSPRTSEANTKPETVTPDSADSAESYGPSPRAVLETYGPEPPPGGRAVVLVLGPGYARGFAHAGVFQGLQEAKIRVGAIVTSEMGALVAALYGTSKTINEFEWTLLKLREENAFFNRSSMPLLWNKNSDGKKLEKMLANVFGKKDLKQSKILLRILLQKEDSDGVVFAEQGRLVDIIRAALSLPGVMDSGQWDGGKAFSAIQKRPYPVLEARLLGMGPVVVVDLLGELGATPGHNETDHGARDLGILTLMEKVQKLGANDLKSADLVIRPSMSGISFFDFKKKTEAMFRGKSAIKDQMPAIRQLVGLPEVITGASLGAAPGVVTPGVVK